MSVEDTDPADIDTADLYPEWERVYEQVDYFESYDGQEAAWDRHVALYKEMRERFDVEFPECEECGNDTWSQAAGEPPHCGACDHVPVDDGVEAAIHNAQQEMLRRAGEAANEGESA